MELAQRLVNTQMKICMLWFPSVAPKTSNWISFNCTNDHEGDRRLTPLIIAIVSDLNFITSLEDPSHLKIDTSLRIG